MRRKVSRIGSSTLMVSLPSKWCKANNVQKGDEIEINIKTDELILSTQKKQPEKRSIIIKIPSKNKFARRSLNIPYMAGYDEIKLISTDRDVLHHAQKHIVELLGFEIIDQGKDFLLLRNVAQGLEEEYPQIFERLFNVVLLMGEELLNNKNPQSLTTVLDMETNANKLCRFCKRLIIHQNLPQTYGSFVMVNYLEAVADAFRDCSADILDHGTVLRKQTTQFLKKILEFLRLARKLHHSFSHDLLGIFKEQELHLLSLEKELYKSSSRDLYICSRLSAAVSHIHHMSESMSSGGMD